MINSKSRGAAPPAYRDDPSLEDAVSMHTTRADDDDIPDLGGAPPSYTDVIAPPGVADRNPGYNMAEHVIKRVNDVDLYALLLPFSLYV